jgi:nitrous oxidase accessory protein
MRKSKILVCLLLLTLGLSVQTIRLSADNGSSLQTLIDSASSGAVLAVPAGNYTGSVVINKPLSLIGRSRENTIIQITSGSVALFVNCSGVQVENLTIQADSVGSVGSVGVSVAHLHITPDQFGAWDIRDVYVSDMIIQDCAYPVSIEQSVGNVTVKNCIISGAGHAVIMHNCIGVNVENCTISASSGGIYLNQFNSANTITGNNISQCMWGIIMQDSWSNTVTLNTLSFNQIGTSDMYNTASNPLPSTSSNLFYLNNFVNNTIQAQLDFSVLDRWDNGTYGNYWSDYIGNDSNHDGIGDTPYLIGGFNVDQYPLMSDPPSLTPAGPQAAVAGGGASFPPRLD